MNVKPHHTLKELQKCYRMENNAKLARRIHGVYLSGSIKAVSSTRGGLTSNAEIVSSDGDIGTIKFYEDINGKIHADGNIKSISSKTGGLGANAMIITNEGDIGVVKFENNVEGKIIAEGQIKTISGKSDLIKAVIRSGSEIGKVSFDNITDSKISSWGDINSVQSKYNIVDSYLLAGYDIGIDGDLGGDDVDYGLNQFGGEIKFVKNKSGNFYNTFAMAGLRPVYDLTKEKWVQPPKDAGNEYIAIFGEITIASLWQVTVADDDPIFKPDPYGLFAATTIGERVRWHHEVLSTVQTDGLIPDFRTEEY